MKRTIGLTISLSGTSGGLTSYSGELMLAPWSTADMLAQMTNARHRPAGRAPSYGRSEHPGGSMAVIEPEDDAEWSSQFARYA